MGPRPGSGCAAKSWPATTGRAGRSSFTRAANTCDHIERVEDRPDLFWEPSNLRASCRYHNLFRHHPARVVAGKPSPDPELAEPHHPLVTPMRKVPRLY